MISLLLDLLLYISLVSIGLIILWTEKGLDLSKAFAEKPWRKTIMRVLMLPLMAVCGILFINTIRCMFAGRCFDSGSIKILTFSVIFFGAGLRVFIQTI